MAGEVCWVCGLGNCWAGWCVSGLGGWRVCGCLVGWVGWVVTYSDGFVCLWVCGLVDWRSGRCVRVWVGVSAVVRLMMLRVNVGVGQFAERVLGVEKGRWGGLVAWGSDG